MTKLKDIIPADKELVIILEKHQSILKQEAHNMDFVHEIFLKISSRRLTLDHIVT